MRVLSISTESKEWASRYDLPDESDRCPKCGIERVANVPFFLDGYRGLMSELHDCGESYRLRVFRPVGVEVEKWEMIGRPNSSDQS